MTDPPGEVLEWDTAFFGRRVARVAGGRLDPARIRELEGWCREGRVDCLYFEADPADPVTIRAAEDSGFRLMDVRLTLTSTGAPADGTAGPAVLRPGELGDGDVLRAIADTAFRDTRFARDPAFAGRAPELYRTWITRSLEGWADAVWVGEFDGRAAGFITCHLAAPGGRIGLVGVDPGVRRHGLGTDLIRRATAWFRERGAVPVRVTTQGMNAEAQRLYQRCGFVTESLRLVYHRWRTPDE